MVGILAQEVRVRMNHATTRATWADMNELTQEAVELAHRLGFGQRPAQQAVEGLTASKTQVLDILDGGALFCWGNDDCDIN